MTDTPKLTVEVPDAGFRGDADMQTLWWKTGVLVDVARAHMTDDKVFWVMLARLYSEMQRHHGAGATKEMLTGFIATMDEAVKYYLPGKDMGEK